MATLTVNKKRTYEVNEDAVLNDVDIIAADIVYEGAAVGESSSSGTGRPLVAGDVFLGFCIAKTDNASGSASAKQIRVRQKGTVKLAVTGVSGVADVGATVYASDDDTFTLSSTSNTAIGKIVRHVSSTTVMVRFEAAQVRSI